MQQLHNDRPFSFAISGKQLACIALALFVLAKLLQGLFGQDARKRRSLPPGPKGSYLFGVTGEMLDQSEKPWVKFERWSKQHNAHHLLYVRTLGTDSIIVNSMQAANELLEKRHKLYSGKPRNVFDAEIVEGNMVLANIDEPDAVSRRRKLLNEDLGAQGCRRVQPIQLEEARRFCLDLVKRPTSYISAINDSARVLVRRITYGEIRSMTPEQLWAHVHNVQTRAKPALHPLLLVYPALRYLPDWFPGGGFWKIGRQYHEQDSKIWQELVEDVGQQMAEGNAPHSVTSQWISNDAGKRYGLNKKEVAFAVGNLITAGGDLPEVTLRIFLATMLHFPEARRKAQAEIDTVVGRDRLPNHEDKENLPFTRALILETQRWRPLTPIGVPHVPVEDDVWNGMFIPRGTRMYPSLWSMSRNTSTYPSPETFDPSRFLREDGSFTKRNELPTWGFGGRKCSATHLAEATLFINIVTMLWAFNFVPAVNAEGKAILPSLDWQNWEDISPCAPPKFDMTCRVRGPEVEDLLKVECAALTTT